MSDRSQIDEMHEKAAPQMPDLAAREPAEGDLDVIDRMRHLSYPDQEPSSGIPVEGGALGEEV